MADIKNADGLFMQEYKRIFEEYMTKEFTRYSQKYQPQLAEAMKYSLFAGGKRIRPILAMCACKASGDTINDALPAALALEAVHTYSLIHDDLPGMDNDDYRRGKLTNHKVYGEAAAILAGDALLTMAFEILGAYGEKNPANAWQMTKILAERAGAGGMCAGQTADIAAENKEISPVELNYIHEHKTADLIIAALLLGALAGGADKEALTALNKFGEMYGLAFQITDDILDVIGDEKKLGKKVGSDDKNHKVTFATLYGVNKAQKMAEKAVNEAKAALSSLKGDTADLLWLADYLIGREC